MDSIGGVNPSEFIVIFLQVEMMAVLVILHIFTAVRIGTKVMVFAVLCARRDWWELRKSVRQIVNSKGSRDKHHLEEKV